MIFADGVGLARAGPGNPLSTETTPNLRRLLGGPLTSEGIQEREGLLLAPLDAGLGLPGLPQSATGQTALFTGINAAALLGFHATAYPGPRLREVIAEHSLFRRAVQAGLRASFANAYTRGYLEALERGQRPASVTTWAVRAAGLPLRTVADLRRGEAVTWDVVGDLFSRRSGEEVPAVEPAAAGRRLAALAAGHDLTVYETFVTDLAGHHRFGLTAAAAVDRLDGLVGGVLEALGGQTTLLLTSDHGNLEDASSRLHTLNPVPLLAAGPRASEFAGLTSILEVTPALLEVLNGPEA